ncbi:dephospho-CoA kinase [Blastochloris viridis]|uniref:Dephospho-CoA kinase n=1 Tax=Blastochloris viridis TaxID=1079 RepID=A0A0H5B9S3_BLAVI|nr:dephospho-CoA kinase [Blastochloris viridis]ALK11040.1 Dephospho-CoA kinase [Blastochloris viridis]BAR98972.1 dephospho-CoA kinase [Blastochloris viridis]CUU43702.1 Dephospho-CoA kinase [Blastochloris viridis]
MIVLGLTGSIGMGKSATAQMFAEAGVPVHDSDAAVHRLYRANAVAAVEARFPGTTTAAGVDRDALARRVLGDAAAIADLEAIVHPLVRADADAFLATARAAARRVVVLDIPLLFETGGAARVDAVVVVSAPKSVQRTRVLARPGMTEDKLAAILAKQMPDEEKRRRAHFVINTGRGVDAARAEVLGLLRTVNMMARRR